MNNSKMSPLLQQAEANVESKVPADMKEAYTKIVTAAMKTVFSPKTHGGVMDGLDKSKNQIHDVAVGSVGLLIMLFQQSKNTMPIPPMVYAGMTIVLHGLDYLERAHGVKIDKKEIDTATQLFVSTILPKLGIDDKMMQKSVAMSKQAMSNPQLMAKFKAQQGGAK